MVTGQCPGEELDWRGGAEAGGQGSRRLAAGFLYRGTPRFALAAGLSRVGLGLGPVSRGSLTMLRAGRNVVSEIQPSGITEANITLS